MKIKNASLRTLTIALLGATLLTSPAQAKSGDQSTYELLNLFG